MVAEGFRVITIKDDVHRRLYKLAKEWSISIPALISILSFSRNDCICHETIVGKRGCPVHGAHPAVREVGE